MWSNDPKQLAAKLRKAADEMRAEDKNGWPVLCDTVADYLEAAPSPSPSPGVVEALRGEIDRLRPHYLSTTATDAGRRQMLDHFAIFLASLSQPALADGGRDAG